MGGDVPTDRGVAILLALIAAALLSALGLGLSLLADTERQVAANDVLNDECLYAANAALERAVQDLALNADWNGIVSGAVTSAFADGTHQSKLSALRTIDLDGVTANLQSASHAAFGPAGPVWHLFAWGPLSEMAAGRIRSTQYIAVWVADDSSETDGNPGIDSNATLAVHAESYGSAGPRRIIDATVTRVAPGALRMVSWRLGT